MITIKAKYAQSCKDTIKGLVGEENIYPLLIQTRWGIHTFGMKKPIDIVILDNENKIMRIKENLKPNSIFFWNPKYNKVLELPERTVKHNKLRFGLKISIRNA